VDNRDTNGRFARDLGLSFPLLSDETTSVTKAYGILMPLIHLAKRTTFVIDKNGRITAIQKGGSAMDPDNALGVCAI
jgi:peroxiredoxin Q/BCP